MPSTLLWSERQTAELRPAVLKAIKSAEPVTCPEDGATLQLDPDHSILNLLPSVWVRCPKCQRMDRFA